MARELLLRGMLAGLLAGLLAFAVASVAGEPPLELAIGFEAAHEHVHGAAAEPEVVSRAVQRGAGLLTACVAVGVALGGLLALAFAAAWGRVGRIGAGALAGVLATAGFVVVVLVPQLKYPANPPSVGSPESIGLRTVLYFEMMLMALGALVLAVLLGRRLLARLGAPGAWLAAAVAFVVLVGALQVVLPGIDEVPEGFPMDVLWRFRLGALATQAVLWVGLGGIFAMLAGRAVRARV